MHEIKDKIQFVDDALHPNALNHHHLHLHLSPNGLAYSIYNPSTSNFAACCTYQNISDQIHLDVIFSKDQWLRSEFGLVKVMFSNHLFTFVPNALYEEQHIPNYLSFNLIEPDSFFQERNPMVALEAQNIFCVKREPKIVVNKYHPNNKVFHSSTPLIEGILQEHGKTTDKKLFVFAWNDHDLEIVAIQDGKLILYNHFEVNGDEELVYFPLYVCQQLKFIRDDVQVFAGGLLNSAYRASTLLKKYFKKVSFTGLPPAFTYSPGLQHQTGNLAWSMAYLALCE